MVSQYLTKMGKKVTPQFAPIPGSNQVANSNGGFSFKAGDWERLDRFLILGSEGGSFYATEHALTRENCQVVERCIALDGIKVVSRVQEISEGGKAAKNDPALFALALCMCANHPEVRHYAGLVLPKVARTGTHLMHFAAYVDSLRGWGRGLRNAIGGWYLDKPVGDLAYQVVKYQSRDKWSNRDLLRLSHPHTDESTRNDIFKWIVDGWESVGEQPHPEKALQLIWAFERAKVLKVDKKGVSELCNLINTYGLTREMVPTEFLVNVDVWDALLVKMPLTAMVRNLATMTKIGLIAPMSAATRKVVAQLHDETRIKKARVHPIALLSAMTTYAGGKGIRGNSTWNPVSQVSDALNDAFYLSFNNVIKTGLRWNLALDISGSMTWTTIAGVPGLTPRDASAALALVTAAVEQNYVITAFTSATGTLLGSGITSLDISPKMRLDGVVQAIARMRAGGTDCALPMLWAAKNKIPVDVFTVYTDSETWAGAIHPTQALKQYRDKMGINAKLITVGMVSNGFTIADPTDPNQIDVVGFSTDTPNLISNFGLGFDKAEGVVADADGYANIEE
jgi:60 kDa SS-A/Ro ribonucleoprotein